MGDIAKMTVEEAIARYKELVEKYPFLYPRNAWTGEKVEDYDYTYTELDGWPQGWVEAFGEMFAEDLNEALQKSGKADEYYVEQVKEKWGSARWYDNFETKEMQDVVSKYEHVSENTCVICGAYPVNLTDDGWITPICFKCFYKNLQNRTYNKEQEITEEEAREWYEKITCVRAADASPIAKFAVFDKNGNHEYSLDCSDVIERMKKKRCGR